MADVIEQAQDRTTEVIRLENVSKVYRTGSTLVYALREVNLEVLQGEFLAVCGPSGAGKSTLLTLIGSLQTPTSGIVNVCGMELNRLSPRERARFRATKIGFVFQLFHLMPYLNVVDNVLLAVDSANRRAARPRAIELLEQFQLGHRLRHKPGELSAGECQRVAIARALINNPELLLADEPTGNLDRENATVVLELLRQINQEGRTIVLATHQDFAAGYASRIVRLREGRLVDDGKLPSD